MPPSGRRNVSNLPSDEREQRRSSRGGHKNRQEPAAPSGHVGQILALLLCTAMGVLWACMSLIGGHTMQQKERNLLQRISELERQLEEEHRTAAWKQQPGSDAGGSESLVNTLSKEVMELQQKNKDLEWRLGVNPGQEQASEAGSSLRQRAENAAAAGNAGYNAAPALRGSPQLPARDPVAAALPPPLAVGARLTESDLRAYAAADAIGVAVITCKRPNYLQRAMESYLRPGRDPRRFPIVISQDGNDAGMDALVESNYVTRGIAFHLRHEHDPNALEIAKTYNAKKPQLALGYIRIAQHYGFVMKTMFDVFGFRQVIFLEEDMEIAPDFFSYFDSMLTLLRADPMLFCVSAWNDNGYRTLVQDVRAAFRTEFFPGLGWMMQKTFWDEVRDRWTSAYWDEFMRRPDVRKGRSCLRPEVSRTMTFGEKGTSSGQFFKGHLSKIRLNDEAVDWASVDLTPLATAEAFDEYLRQRLRSSVQVHSYDVDYHNGRGEDLRIEYDDKQDYKNLAKKFDLMPDEKEGIRRMAYRGVIPFAWNGNRVLLHTRTWPDSGAIVR